MFAWHRPEVLPSSDNLYERLAAQVADDSAPVLRCAGGDCGAQRAYSYRQLHEHSGRFAQALYNLNVQAGDRVVVQVDKSAAALFLYLACLRVGAVYVPLNTAYTLAELDHFLADAAPRVLVGAPTRLAQLLPLAQRLGVPHVLTLDASGEGGSLPERARGLDPGFLTVARSADDAAAILYTSGTTGRSKGAVLTHGNLAANAFALRDCWQYSARDVLLHALPIFHIHGLFVAVNVTLAAGASMVLLPAFNADAVLAWLPRVSVFMGVPTFYVRLLQDERLNAAAASAVRLFISGSAPLLPETHAAWRSRTGQAILERYGMTETGIISSNPCAGERRAGTVGLPLPDVQVRIVDLDSTRELPQGQTGMIEVRGPSVFSGYWRLPDKTRAEFRDGYFVTGDVGRFDERGYLCLVGRGKDLIITGGYNVYPREVESQIDALPGVQESAVIGLPHPDFGEGVTALVVTQPAGDLTEACVVTRLRDNLAGYKCPKRVLFLADLPRNAMGKVQKNVLREQFKTLYGPAGAGPGASTTQRGA